MADYGFISKALERQREAAAQEAKRKAEEEARRRGEAQLKAKYPFIEGAAARVSQVLNAYAKAREIEDASVTTSNIQGGYRLSNGQQSVSLTLDLQRDGSGNTFKLSGADPANEDTLGQQLANATGRTVITEVEEPGYEGGDMEGGYYWVKGSVRVAKMFKPR